MPLAEQTLDIPLFTLKGQIHTAKCVKCYDADTIHVVFSLHGAFTRFRCRLKGIDTAELRSKNSHEKACAKESRDYLKTIIMNKIVTIHCFEFDKYGRLFVDVYYHDSNHAPVQHPNQKEKGGDQISRPLHINSHLVECGYAYSYHGGKRLSFENWHPTTPPDVRV